MSNESVFLPAAVRDRIWDLLKERKVTQAELAARIGCSESSLSRFISGKTDKLGDENIIRIARVFNVSTDFLLGEVRYLSVKKAYPNEAEELFAEAQKMAQQRYKTYVRKTQENWED